MVLPNVPIVNAGLLYVNGLNLENSINVGGLTVTAGAARDSTNTTDIILPVQASLSLTTVGAGGLDTGELVENKFYAVYVIGSDQGVVTSDSELGGGYNSKFQPVNASPDPTPPYPTSILISLNGTSPILPMGYNAFRRLGWIRTELDGSDVVISAFNQYGNTSVRTMYYYDNTLVLEAGIDTSFTTLPIAIGVGANANVPAVPKLEGEVIFAATFTPAAATDVLEIAPYIFPTPPDKGYAVFGSGVNAVQVATVVCPCQLNGVIPSVSYKVTAGTLALSVVGYVDYL